MIFTGFGKDDLLGGASFVTPVCDRIIDFAGRCAKLSQKNSQAGT
jgi:hypothetical protein